MSEQQRDALINQEEAKQSEEQHVGQSGENQSENSEEESDEERVSQNINAIRMATPGSEEGEI